MIRAFFRAAATEKLLSEANASGEGRVEELTFLAFEEFGSPMQSGLTCRGPEDNCVSEIGAVLSERE